MFVKLTMCVMLLLTMLLNITAVANSPGGRWYYAGEAGKWRYATTWNARGEYPLDCLRSQWLQDPDDHHWYYLDRDGWMLTGVQELDGIRYRFRDQAHQGNYFPDIAQTDRYASGFYSYRANGRPTYGSLTEILSDPAAAHGSGGSSGLPTGTDVPTPEPENPVPSITTIPEPKHPTPSKPEEPAPPTITMPTPEKTEHPDSAKPRHEEKSSPSDIPKPASEKASASDIPRPLPEKASASDIPRPLPEKASPSDIIPTGPTQENERRQELEEDEQIHSHVDRDDADSHCIAYDLWRRILQHPLDYEDCFENRCTSRLYLTGAASLPGEPAATEAQIPLYVSLLRSPTESVGHLELVQAYAADRLCLPMQCGLDGNVGGAGETLPWALLNGGTYRWTDTDGMAQTMDYPGFRLYSRETDDYLPLSPEETTQCFTQGFAAECRGTENFWDYYNWREAGFAGGDNIDFLTRTKGRFHFLSEQDLFGTAAASVPLPQKTDYPAAEDSWRSETPYWLSSTPCSGIWVTDRLEYMDPEMPGSLPQLDYAAAGKHYLLYDTDAPALDAALFADAASADRAVGSAEATESRMLRLRFRLKAIPHACAFAGNT